MNKLSPIIVFCYNRPQHLKKTIEALKNNSLAADSELFIFSDGYKGDSDKLNVLELRNYLKSITGFKKIEIFESDQNKGLANSVIDGVSKIICQYGKVIVVEDDLITSSSFLTFMNESLEEYQNNKEIFSISGYVPPLKIDKFNDEVFLFPRISSWGWGTWLDRWTTVDWELKNVHSFFINKNKIKEFNQGGMDLTPMLLNQIKGDINSWAIRFSYSCYLQKAYCLYPIFSLVKNIGADGSGTHLKGSRKYEVRINEILPILTQNPLENIEFGNQLLSFHKLSVIRQIINFIKRYQYLFTKHD